MSGGKGRPAGDPWDDPEMKRWARRCVEELVPKMRSSGSVISIVPDETDIKFAVETGLAIMMDKPLILMVPPGVRVPPKLLAVADEVVEWDPDRPERLKAAIDRIFHK